MRWLGLFSHASLCSINYVVKTLIEKKAHYPNKKAPLPNLGNLPGPGWEPMWYYYYNISCHSVVVSFVRASGGWDGVKGEEGNGRERSTGTAAEQLGRWAETFFGRSRQIRAAVVADQQGKAEGIVVVCRISGRSVIKPVFHFFRLHEDKSVLCPVEVQNPPPLASVDLVADLECTAGQCRFSVIRRLVPSSHHNFSVPLILRFLAVWWTLY